MRKLLYPVMACLCLALIFSCAKSASPSGKAEKVDLQPGATGIPNLGSVKMAPVTIRIAGFGVAKTTNRQMAETWAQRNASASLIQQGGGFTFSYNPGTRELQLDAFAEAAFSGQRDPAGLKVYQQGEHWEAVAVYRSELPVKIPAGAQTGSCTTTVKLDQVNSFFLETARAALDELLNDADTEKETLVGKLHLQDVVLEPAGTGSGYNAVTTYFIAWL